MSSISWSESLPPHAGILPPIFCVPSLIVIRNAFIGWCQAWPVPLSGGGGYFPSGPRWRQFGAPSALAPWQTAQFATKSFLPRVICAKLNALSGLLPETYRSAFWEGSLFWDDSFCWVHPATVPNPTVIMSKILFIVVPLERGGAKDTPPLPPSLSASYADYDPWAWHYPLLQTIPWVYRHIFPRLCCQSW